MIKTNDSDVFATGAAMSVPDGVARGVGLLSGLRKFITRVFYVADLRTMIPGVSVARRPSGFRRISRDAYKKYKAHYGERPVCADKSWVWGCVAFYALYAAVFAAAHSWDETLFNMMAGWTNPWWDDVVERYVPAMHKMTADFIAHGYADRVAFLRHIISMSAMFSITQTIVTLVEIYRRSFVFGVRQSILLKMRNSGISLRMFILLGLALTITGFGGWYALMVPGWITFDNGYPETFILFAVHTSGLAGAWVVSTVAGMCMFAVGGCLILYETCKIYWTNVRLKNRKEAG